SRRPRRFSRGWSSDVCSSALDASSPEHAIWHAPTADAAVDLLVGGRCGILIADLGTLRGEAAALLDRLHAQFPELVLMATGRRGRRESGREGERARGPVGGAM